jgi:CHASE3 domain sensor protein
VTRPGREITLGRQQGIVVGPGMPQRDLHSHAATREEEMRQLKAGAERDDELAQDRVEFSREAWRQVEELEKVIKKRKKENVNEQHTLIHRERARGRVVRARAFFQLVKSYFKNVFSVN